MKRVVVGVCVASAGLVLSSVPAVAVTAAPPNIVYAETSWRLGDDNSQSFDSGAFTYLLTAADLGKSEALTVRTPTTAPVALRAGNATAGVLGPQFVVGDTQSLSGGSGTFATSLVSTFKLRSDCTGPWQASVHVLDVGRDSGGVLTGLAVDFSVSCFYSASPTVLKNRTVGSLRFGSSSGTVAYGVPAVGSGWVAPSPTPSGVQRAVVVPVASAGDGVSVSGVTLFQESGVALADDGCTGQLVTAGSPCQLTFSVTPPAGSSTVRLTADVTTSDGRVTRLQRSIATRGPLVAPLPRPYPIAGAIAVRVEPSVVPTDTVTIRRRTPGGAWVDLATMVDAAAPDGSYPHVVDEAALPGATYEYSTVLASADGLFTATSAPVTARRPDVDGVPGDRTRIALQYGGASAPPHVADSATGLVTVVTTSTAGTGSTVSLRDPVTSVPVAEVTGGLIPGPGSYPLGNAVTVDSTIETGFEAMVVRDVLYAEDGTLLLLDASMRKVSGATPVAAEVRFRVAGGLAVPVADPAKPTVVADPSSDSTPQTITITNTGPETLTVGASTVTGTDAASWTASACTPVTLAAGQSCTLSAVFHGAAAPGTASARIEVSTTAGGTSIPVLIPVTGRTSDLPGPPRFAGASVLPGRVLIAWYLPEDDGGRPITASKVERRADPESPWVVIPTVGDPVGDPAYTVDEAPIGGAAQYRVSAVSSRGAGTPSDALTPGQLSQPSTVSAVVGTDAERTAGAPWGLWFGVATIPIPLQVDGHEHEAPAVTPTGDAVIVPRAATAGAGKYDYDLWRIPVDASVAPTRLTSLVGAEVDPEVSPDGTRIAFTYFPPMASTDRRPQVWIMNADGSGQSMRLTGFSRPTWETSTRLVVSDDRTATGPLVRVTVVGATVGTPVAIPGTQGGYDPSVNPDGSLIAFVDATGEPSLLDVATGTVSDADPSGYTASVDASLPTWLRPMWPVFARSDLSTFAPYSAIELPVGNVLDAAHLSVFPTRETTPPVIGASSAYVTSTGYVKIAVTDQGSTRRGVTVTCSVDGVVRACVSPDGGFGVSAAGLAQGKHTLVISAVDVWGNAATTASRTFTVDGVAPPAPSVTMLTWTKATSVAVSFRSTDATPITYEVRQRTWPIGQDQPNSWAPAVLTTSTTRTVSIPARYSTCVQVRARDAAGNVGAWSAERCATRPLDERDLAPLDAGWKRTLSSAYYLGSAVGVKATGRRLVTVTNVTASQVVLLAMRCPTCGTVSVYIGDVKMGSVSLRSSTTTTSAVVTLPRTSRRTGQLELRTTSSGLVRIDAVVPAR